MPDPLDEQRYICPLCQRKVPEVSDHHLIPKSRGGRQTQAICLDCHRMIHVLFDNKQLEREYGTVEALRAEPRMSKYLQWIGKRSGGRRYRARRSHRR